tara:strand:+ start:39508 stop:40368 length:861 start_codon:yes stop_codon:yes gene_type:complete
MALRFDWEKRIPAGLGGFDSRAMLWLWCRRVALGYSLNPAFVKDLSTRANHLIDSIKSHDEETVRQLEEYRDEYFAARLDDSEFKWIDYRDDRLVRWLLEMLEWNSVGISFAISNFDQSVLTPRARVELAFDFSQVPLAGKAQAMERLRKTWSSLIEVDPNLAWVDVRDEEQCRWLVDVIKDSELAPWIHAGLQSPVNNKERYLLVVNTLDRSGWPLKAKKLVLRDIKSKWRRKKSKEEGKKVQCNLNVDSATKEGIKQLADDRKLKMGELIDALVAKELERKRNR